MQSSCITEHVAVPEDEEMHLEFFVLEILHERFKIFQKYFTRKI